MKSALNLPMNSLDRARKPAKASRMRRSSLALVAVFGFFGCAAADDGELGTDVAPLTFTLPGSYSVPVSDPSLESQATNPVTIKVKRVAGTVRVHYSLPAQLVGSDLVSIDLQGPDTGDTLYLTGPMGVGTCTGALPPGTLTCNETFGPIAVNLDGVRQTAIADGLSATETDKRVEVATRFAMDPIGIMKAERGAADSNGGAGAGDPGKGGGRRGGRNP
jgi:hypothetical protein